MPYRRVVSALFAIASLMVPGTMLAQQNPASDEARGSIGAGDAPEQQPSEEAAAWRESFAADAALTYFRRGDKAAVIVVAAGEHSEAELAADTLEETLRDSGEFFLVMNDDVLADNTKVDDEKIVEKAKHLPVGQVAVVRVYAGAAGKPPAVVVTLYDKDTGEAGTAMSVTRGTEARPSDRPPPSAGVEASGDEEASDEAAERGADIAAKTAKTAQRAADPMRRRYLAQHVWFDETDEDADALDQWKRVYRGDQKQSLDGEAFYYEIGRPDLADAYGTQQVIKWSIVAGVLTVGAGSAAAIMLTGEPGNQSRLGTAGAVGGGAFLGAALVGMYYNPHPIELDEARKLANEHNEKLRDELGLPDEAADEQASNLKWSFGVSPRGVSAGFRF